MIVLDVWNWSLWKYIFDWDVSYYNYISIWPYYIVIQFTLCDDASCLRHIYMALCCNYTIILLKRPSLFAVWLFWTFHTKSYNKKALVILNHSWSPFLLLTCLYGKNELLWFSVQPSGVFSWEKLLPDYPWKSHDHDQLWSDLVMTWLP